MRGDHGTREAQLRLLIAGSDRELELERVWRVATADDAAAVLESVLAGEGGVVEFVSSAQVTADLIDDLRSIAVVDVIRDDGAGSRLDDTQRRLLVVLADGASMSDAADAVHLSVRSAWRRLAAARAILGVATNCEAIAVVDQLPGL